MGSPVNAPGGYIILTMSEAQDIMHLLRHLNKINKVIDVAEAIQIDLAIDLLKANGCYFKTLEQGNAT